MHIFATVCCSRTQTRLPGPRPSDAFARRCKRCTQAPAFCRSMRPPGWEGGGRLPTWPTRLPHSVDASPPPLCCCRLRRLDNRALDALRPAAHLSPPLLAALRRSFTFTLGLLPLLPSVASSQATSSRRAATTRRTPLTTAACSAAATLWHFHFHSFTGSNRDDAFLVHCYSYARVWLIRILRASQAKTKRRAARELSFRDASHRVMSFRVSN